MATRVCVVGARGRMGSRVVRLMDEFPDLSLVSALERDVALEGADVGELLGGPESGVPVATDPHKAIKAADVVVDFSAPAAAALIAPICAREDTAYLCASTGLGEVETLAINAAAQSTAVLLAANVSVGVTLMVELARQAAERLGPEFDVEISEIHHRHKKDAPSGTALALGRAVHEGRSGLKDVLSRSGVGDARGKDELGYGALRGGDVAGEHTVFFFGDGERIELTHRATTPEIFARGALRGASWLAGKAPGTYSMRDVLGYG